MSSALDITEKEWDAQLFGSQKGLATMLGWKLAYHTLRSKGSQPGFPDRVIVRDRIIFVELKREGGKPTERQRTWLDGLARAGGEAYLWQPSDLDEISKVLSKEWWYDAWADEPCMGTLKIVNDHGYLRDQLQPGSLWISGVGRTDSTSQLDLAC